MGRRQGAQEGQGAGTAAMALGEGWSLLWPERGSHPTAPGLADETRVSVDRRAWSEAAPADQGGEWGQAWKGRCQAVCGHLASHVQIQGSESGVHCGYQGSANQ